MRRTVAASVLGWTLWALPAHAEWVRRVADGIMGTRITVELWATDRPAADRATDAVLDEMRRLDAAMSTYQPTSEVSLVNARAASGPMRITVELFDLLTTAREYSVITDGAFDITYASVGYLYDFRKHLRPDDQHIAAALPAVNYRHVVLDPRQHTVRFSQQGVRIDLGGIAKGYAVDCGIGVLQRLGVTRAYVSAGGDSRIIGDRFGKPWIIDPRTGHSASKVRSATIVGPYATRTDGLSKTAFVLGPEKAMAIYDRLEDIDAIIIKLDGTVIHSKGIERAR